MKKIISLWYNRICDVLEVYIPSLIFVFLFLSYVVIIAYRYIFSQSFSGLYELNTLSFVWCGTFAASYGSRTESHVRFTILYDVMTPKVKMVMRFIGDLFIISTFSLMLPSAMKNLKFMGVRKSSILKLPFNWVYSPFLIFICLTILHQMILLVKDVVSLAHNDFSEPKGGEE